MGLEEKCLREIINEPSKGEISDISFREYGRGGREANLVHEKFKGKIKVYQTERDYEVELFLENNKKLLPPEVLSPNRQTIISTRWQIYNAPTIYTCDKRYRHTMSIHLKPSN